MDNGVISTYEVEVVAMSIINYANEINKVSAEDRQKNNDKCIDFAVIKINEIILENKIDKMQKVVDEAKTAIDIANGRCCCQIGEYSRREIKEANCPMDIVGGLIDALNELEGVE